MFPSFFIGGFEGTTGYNVCREMIDTVARTQHDTRINEDYALLRTVGIAAVRESVRWPLVDQRGRLNLSVIRPALEAAKRNDVVIIHDLFHFGYPQELDLLSDEFQKRFAEYCYQVARYVARHTDGDCYFTPVNEPSYFAWAAGEIGLFAPYLKGSGRSLKTALVAAAIQGINAIWAACPNARIVNVDPFCRTIASGTDEGTALQAEIFNSSCVFEAWDTLAGLRMPELGGSLRHLGVIGLNYYWTNQWEIDGGNVPLPESDPRRMSLAEIVRTVRNRYGADILITETSHIGENRARWLMDLAAEVETIRKQGIPLKGVCWYPVLEMPEWHAKNEWAKMGLWDLDHQRGTMHRLPYYPALRALRVVQKRLDPDQTREFSFCA